MIASIYGHQRTLAVERQSVRREDNNSDSEEKKVKLIVLNDNQAQPENKWFWVNFAVGRKLSDALGGALIVCL